MSRFRRFFDFLNAKFDHLYQNLRLISTNISSFFLRFRLIVRYTYIIKRKKAYFISGFSRVCPAKIQEKIRKGIDIEGKI